MDRIPWQLNLIVFISTVRYQGVFSVSSPLSSLSFTYEVIRYKSYLGRWVLSFFSFFSYTLVEPSLKTSLQQVEFFFVHVMLDIEALWPLYCDKRQHIYIDVEKQINGVIEVV